MVVFQRIAAIGLLVVSFGAHAQTLIFEGYPAKKVEVSEQTVASFDLEKAQGQEYKVEIVRKGEDYYWASRGGVPLIPSESGVYMTYIAVNGSGYIRVLNTEMREVYKNLPEVDKQNTYLYVEHLTHQLGSITYYGR